jgi:hypothetical protein
LGKGWWGFNFQHDLNRWSRPFLLLPSSKRSAWSDEAAPLPLNGLPLGSFPLADLRHGAGSPIAPAINPTSLALTPITDRGIFW